MDKELLNPLSGFRDLNSPTKDWVTSQLRQIFQRFGYQMLETPALERQELLLGKISAASSGIPGGIGSEAQKQLYLFEDNGARKVGLRYDLTVSLARFVAANFGRLSWPYKRYEIGPAWRAEKAQKGRYRQFTQADVDIVGVESLSAEVELLEILAAAQKALGIKWKVLLNDRQLIRGVLTSLKVAEVKQTALLQTIDKKDKLSADALKSELMKIGLTDIQLRQIDELFLGRPSLDEFAKLADDSAVRVKELILRAKNSGLDAEFAPAMVRGLDYYTGTIIEAGVTDYPSSLAGGGRYDSLVESIIGKKVPAVGLSFGVDRIADLLEQTAPKTAPARFVINLPEAETELRRWVSELRDSGQSVELYPDSAVELGKQIKYADQREYQKVLIPFEAEWKDGLIVEKDLKSGHQAKLNRDQIVHG